VSYWETNREILRKQYGGLLEELSSGDESPPKDIKVETTPAGIPTLCINGIYVNSQRDPLREGQRLAEAVRGENAPIVILGFGLGFSATAAAELGRPVIIVEKYKTLLLKAFELRDFSGFLSQNRIIFVIGGGGEGITSALAIANDLISGENSGKKKLAPSVIRNRALMSLDENWYKSVEDRIRSWTMRDEINTATHKRFGRRWVRNLSRNMRAIRDYPGVTRLEGLAAGNDTDAEPLPVFLAAAGPSLDKIKPLLRDIYERCIIVAVDTNLRFFVKNGIQPDFVLVVDPQFWNSRHLDRCVCECHSSDQAARQTALIAESAVYPPVLSLPFKNKFLCGSVFPLGTFIEKQVDPKGRLGAGGSVASTAWDFARTLGGREIWIAGLDLSFPQLKTHFRGARFEDLSNADSNRFNPAEKWVLRALRDGFPFFAHSANGEKVLTDKRLSLYATWFEAQFRYYSQIKNYTLTVEGLAIPGLHAADTGKFLALPPRRDEIDRRIQRIFSQTEIEFNSPQEKRERTERYEKAVSVLTSALKSIKDTADEGAEIARRALRSSLNPSQQNKIIKELEEITRRVTESEVKEIADFLILPQDGEKAGEEESDVFLAYLKGSLRLFSGIVEAAQLNLELK
jgi:hypothetical protein